MVKEQTNNKIHTLLNTCYMLYVLVFTRDFLSF